MVFCLSKHPIKHIVNSLIFSTMRRLSKQSIVNISLIINGLRVFIEVATRVFLQLTEKLNPNTALRRYCVSGSKKPCINNGKPVKKETISIDLHRNHTNWKDLLKQLKLEYIRRTAPGFFEMSGGYGMKVNPYRDDTANGLTKAICDFIRHIGGYSNRVSTMGVPRKINGQMKWTKGNSNRGGADIRALFNGRSIDIEIKIGRDRMSEHQVKERQRVESAGGLHFIARLFPEFLQWWLDKFPLSVSSIKMEP